MTTALALVCTLKKSPAPSSSEILAREVLDEFATHDVHGSLIRGADHDVHFGVSTDEGDGDAWPTIRRQVLDADILVLATPIWMGQPASVAKIALDKTRGSTRTAVANAVHLASLLRDAAYPKS